MQQKEAGWALLRPAQSRFPRCKTPSHPTSLTLGVRRFFTRPRERVPSPRQGGKAAAAPRPRFAAGLGRLRDTRSLVSCRLETARPASRLERWRRVCAKKPRTTQPAPRRGSGPRGREGAQAVQGRGGLSDARRRSWRGSGRPGGSRRCRTQIMTVPFKRSADERGVEMAEAELRREGETEVSEFRYNSALLEGFF
ncbi:unnamed protein product [Natator depressus]